jgi:hypothetical protein
MAKRKGEPAASSWGEADEPTDDSVAPTSVVRKKLKFEMVCSLCGAAPALGPQALNKMQTPIHEHPQALLRPKNFCGVEGWCWFH